VPCQGKACGILELQMLANLKDVYFGVGGMSSRLESPPSSSFLSLPERSKWIVIDDCVRMISATEDTLDISRYLFTVALVCQVGTLQLAVENYEKVIRATHSSTIRLRGAPWS
jgi:hypothetical protein